MDVNVQTQILHDLPPTVHKLIVRYLYHCSKNDRATLSLVSKSYLQYVANIHSRLDDSQHWEYYLDNAHLPNFTNSLLSAHSLTSAIYTMSLLVEPSNNRYKRISAMQHIDSPAQLDTIDSKCFARLKLLIVDSATLLHPRFQHVIQTLDRVQSTQYKRHLNKLYIRITHPIPAATFALIPQEVSRCLSKVCLVFSNWQSHTGALAEDEYQPTIDYVRSLSNVRKMVLDIHPTLLATLLAGCPTVFPQLTKVDLQTKFTKEEEYPWATLQMVPELAWLSTAFPQASEQFLSFLLRSDTIRTLGSALPTTVSVARNIQRQRSLKDLTLRLLAPSSICTHSELLTFNFMLPEQLNHLTVLYERDDNGPIFDRLMMGMQKHERLNSLAIAKSSNIMRLDNLAFMLVGNRSIEHLTVTNIYGESPSDLASLFTSVSNNNKLKTLTLYFNLTLPLFQQLFTVLETHPSLYKVVVNRKSLPQKFKPTPALLAVYDIQIGSSLVELTRLIK
ncbi:hypothetical protein SAMD00019534_017430 [Acytostelium subglobosum LB1]|uniref:hypothetical protein n=1 Tax=Acytostelium subglobosum LB1 TaxID=1410327 RepID=UPI000644D078|nr:hypothetical protein SAMD00019534_017430 [Acytostelium subglobosum LB1]GAM18568.1 hypothetical protein SAMD00019534_017430 [Acytostelium subglobosum LB1]|eukprot:XP_012757788.1 hypothetical protein SAMD00019534_017430 [Acytostelium subglobosum LB1]